MAELWTLSDAIASLRRRLSDGAADKYVHQMEVDPEPDGKQTVFAVPDSHLVPDTLQVTIGGALATTDDVDVAAGTFTLAAPDEGEKVRANYYFQWFTDAELEEFLGEGAGLVGYGGVTDETLPVGLHPAVLSYACYYAYMKKAAEAADSVTASAAGFSTDTNRQNPNWLAMAKMAWDNAVAEKAAFNEPVGTTKPAMAFVRFRDYRYVPRT